MSLIVNNTSIKGVFVNNTPIGFVYVNGNLVLDTGIQFIGSASASYSNKTTTLISLSGIDIQAGDVIVCASSNGYHTTSSKPLYPSGFTGIFSRTCGGGDTNASLSASYRISNGSETSVSLTSGSNLSSAGGGGVIQVFRNVDTSNIFDVSIAYDPNRNNYTSNANPYPITTARNGAVVVAMGSGVTFSSSISYSNGGLDGFIHKAGMGSSFGSIVGMGYKKLDTAGYYNPAAWGTSPYQGYNYESVTIALRPMYEGQ